MIRITWFVANGKVHVDYRRTISQNRNGSNEGTFSGFVLSEATRTPGYQDTRTPGHQDSLLGHGHAADAWWISSSSSKARAHGSWFALHSFSKYSRCKLFSILLTCALFSIHYWQHLSLNSFQGGEPDLQPHVSLFRLAAKKV